MPPTVGELPLRSERFRLLRELGSGAYGVVYQAFDEERETLVALKILRQNKAAAIYRFKREFRALADLSHPNLVTLYELLSDGEQWYFTMELVEGVDFLSYVTRDDGSSGEDASRSSPTFTERDLLASRDEASAERPRSLSRASLARLRHALPQLVEGIMTLHGRGILHRDIKPRNVLVSEAGRVVLFDFGLASEALQKGITQERALVGTPDYMAPEQIAGAVPSEACDYYSVGVMMYRALTGCSPFPGPLLKSLQDRQTKNPIAPRELAPTVPADLDALCVALLRSRPEDRPSGAEVLSRLGATPGFVPSALETAGTVGQEPHRRELARAFADAKAGRGVVVRVQGRSGMGKTTLVRSFLRELEASEDRVVVLSSRSHERESMPYKTLDGLVDALTAFLTTLTRRRVGELTPKDVGVLLKLFPVLSEVKAFRQAATSPRPASPQRNRELAFAALEEILERLAEQFRLVIHLDDLQWGDPDSVDLILRLHRPRAGMLLILSYRSDGEGSDALPPVLAESSVPAGDVRDVVLEDLSFSQSSQLASMLLKRPGPESAILARTIAREAEGNPLFVCELARHALERGGALGSSADGLTLEGVFLARAERLPAPAQALLRAVAIAGRPIDERVAARASRLDRAELAKSITLLRVGNFVASSGTGNAKLVEPFHDRLRETIVSQLTAEEARELHGKMAVALETSGSRQTDALAYHYLAGGDRERGLHYSLEAARHARDIYAHRDAIRHYETVVELMDPTERRRRLEVQEELASELRLIGEYDRAVALLRSCLKGTESDSELAQLQVGLGKLFRERGDTKSALRELERALSLLGVHPPQNRASLALRSAGEIARRPLRELRARRRSAPEKHLLRQRADVLLALMRIYYFADVGKLFWAGVSVMNLSPHLESERELSQLYSDYGALLFGMGRLPSSMRYCESAITLARSAGDRAAEALALGRLGTCAVFANDLELAARALRESVTTFQEVGDMWELQTSLMLEATSQFLASRFDAAEALYREMGALAGKLDAKMHSAWASAWVPFCRYLTGRETAEEATRELHRAVAASAEVEDVANQCAATMHAANIAVRSSNAEEAAVLAERTFEGVDRYRVRVPFLQIALVDAAEAALYAIENGAQSRSRAALAAIAKKGYRRALRLSKSYPYLRGPALRVKARYLASMRGGRGAKAVFRQAIEQLERTPNRWELGVACHDAAASFPELRVELVPKAAAIFESIGAHAELARLERLSCE